MLITQKHKYALRAVFELAKHYKSGGQIKLADIAEAQAIPLRFLEVIMAELKPSGLVASKRGYYGGYTLLRRPGDITVGEIFRFLDDTQSRDRCNACDARENCPLHGQCAFMPMWDRVQTAIYNVYDQTTIQDLLNNETGLQMIVDTMPSTQQRTIS
jgi:Rrf2 family cysteine metabolism transcriptional repressor